MISYVLIPFHVSSLYLPSLQLELKDTKRRREFLMFQACSMAVAHDENISKFVLPYVIVTSLRNSQDITDFIIEEVFFLNKNVFSYYVYNINLKLNVCISLFSDLVYRIFLLFFTLRQGLLNWTISSPGVDFVYEFGKDEFAFRTKCSQQNQKKKAYTGSKKIFFYNKKILK